VLTLSSYKKKEGGTKQDVCILLMVNCISQMTLCLFSFSISSSHWGRSGCNFIHILAGFELGLFPQTQNSISSVKSCSDLLICLHEPLELNIKVLVLVLEHAAVLVDGVALRLQIIVAV